MNFLKKTVNAIGNGIELELLKSERAKLNKEIKKLKSKCDTFNQQITLKNNMNELKEYIQTNFTHIEIN